MEDLIIFHFSFDRYHFAIFDLRLVVLIAVNAETLTLPLQ